MVTYHVDRSLDDLGGCVPLTANDDVAEHLVSAANPCLPIYWSGGTISYYSFRVKPLPAADLEEVLARTRALWQQTRGKTIFLSGATGFFGKWLLESLVHCNQALELDLKAVILSRDPSKFCAKMPHIARESWIRFAQGDIRSFELPSGEFEYIVHAAAPTAAASSLDAEELLLTLIDGTRRVLSLAKSNGAKRMLFVSSGAVYGEQPAEILNVSEEYRGGPDWINPTSAYAEGKRVAEQLCAIAANCSDIQFAIARCFAFLGPHLSLDQHFAVGNFMADALAGRDIQIRGDGTPKRSYLYAGDLACWLWTILLADAPAWRNPAIVNVGSDEAVSIADLASCVAEELNANAKIRIAQTPVHGGLTQRYVPSIVRAKDWYQLTPKTPLREAIRRTAAWHRT
jgi:nucleoside-diphosphate-sugar epimerase